MKSFFEDYQVKKYLFNDKIKWIFEQYIFGTANTIPFKGIQVEITNEVIVIHGSNFEYSFPPDMTKEIWKRMQRAIRQCK